MTINLTYDDDLVIIALCTNLGIEADDSKPYTNIRYDAIATRLHKEYHTTPKNLLTDKELVKQIASNKEEEERICNLVTNERITRLHFILNDFASKGIKYLTRASKEYPKEYKRKLKNKQPAVIFYVGNLQLLNTNIIGFVGSRDIDEELKQDIKTAVIELIPQNTLISGSAKGTDQLVEATVLEKKGNMILFLSHGLNKKIQDSNIIKALINGNLLIMSEALPAEHFIVYKAMERNKYIYALSSFVIVSKSGNNEGGTWAGATEALKNKYTDVYLLTKRYPDTLKLIQHGAKVYKDTTDYNIDENQLKYQQMT